MADEALLNQADILAAGGDTVARTKSLTQLLSEGWVIVSNKANGYATTVGTSFISGVTATTTKGDCVLTSVTGTLFEGQLIAGTGIAPGSRVLSFASGEAVISLPALASGTGVAITKQTYTTARIQHFNKTGKRIVEVCFVYGNWISAGSTEVANAAPIIIKAAAELKGTVSDQSLKRTKMTFGEQRVKSIDGGSLAFSDAIPCIWEDDAMIFERIGVTVGEAAHFFPIGTPTRGGTTNQGANTGEGVDSGFDFVDTNNTSNNSFSCYSSCLVLGRTEDASITPSCFLVGDSITQGIDDAGYASGWGGWVYRAFLNYPNGWVPIGGETETRVTNPESWYSRARLSVFATHIIDAYGRNDLSPANGNRTVAQLKADVLAKARAYMARGQHYVKSTILPEPSSTNGWYDVAGQTKSSFDAARVEFNTWVRDPDGFVAEATAQVADIVGAGLAVAIDPCALLECNSAGVLTENGGYVLPATGTDTSGTATAAATSSVTDSGKTWTVNAFKGKTIEITGGTGAGQSRCILYNSATVITTSAAFSPALNTTSQYRVTDAIGFTTGPHPHTRGHVLAASAIDADAIMAL